MLRIVAIAAGICVAGCAVRSGPATWRLSEKRLIPPGIRANAPPTRKFIAAAEPGKRSCSDDTAPVLLRKQHQRLHATVNAEALARQAPGWLNHWAFTLETQGCLSPGGAASLAKEVSETVPLEPNGAFRLLYSVSPVGDWIELPPGSRLQLTSPILRDPSGSVIAATTISGLSVTVRASDNLIGFETTTYDVRPRTGGPGSEFAVRSIRRTIDGKEQETSQPAVNYPALLPDLALFRLVYKTGQTAFTALLIGANSPAEMDQQMSNANSCTQLPPDRCIAIPRNTGVNPVVPVMVNGAEVPLRLGASVGEAIRQAGWRLAGLPPKLTVSRPHRGRLARIDFAPGDPTILTLTALGGDTISWDRNAPGQPAVARLSVPEFPAPGQMPGKLVDAGGRLLHLYCTGSGEPLVMIAGAGFSFDWDLVQTEVAKFTRVCTYDPAGTAWSEAGISVECQTRVDEIHRILAAERKGKPVVLAGLSIGALVARLYVAEYPKEVSGIVMLDHAFLNPGAANLSPGKSFAPSGQTDTPPVLLEMTPIEITAEDDPGFTQLPDRIKALHRWAAARKPVMPTIANAQGCLDAVNAATEGKPQPLRELPLVVVSTGNETPNYAALQKDLLALSGNSRQMMALRSFHAIGMSEPDVATAAIRAVVDAVLGGGRLE